MQTDPATSPRTSHAPVAPGGSDPYAIPPIRARAIVAGVLSIVALCVIVAGGDLVAANIQIGMMQLPAATIGVLFVLVAVNQALAGRLARWRLSTSEVAVAFVMMMPAALISSRGLMEKWLPMLVGVRYFGAANGWDRMYFPYIPRLLVPWDPHSGTESAVVRWFYEGLPAGSAVPWRA